MKNLKLYISATLIAAVIVSCTKDDITETTDLSAVDKLEDKEVKISQKSIEDQLEKYPDAVYYGGRNQILTASQMLRNIKSNKNADEFKFITTGPKGSNSYLGRDIVLQGTHATTVTRAATSEDLINVPELLWDGATEDRNSVLDRIDSELFPGAVDGRRVRAVATFNTAYHRTGEVAHANTLNSDSNTKPTSLTTRLYFKKAIVVDLDPNTEGRSSSTTKNWQTWKPLYNDQDIINYPNALYPGATLYTIERTTGSTKTHTTSNTTNVGATFGVTVGSGGVANIGFTNQVSLGFSINREHTSENSIEDSNEEKITNAIEYPHVKMPPHSECRYQVHAISYTDRVSYEIQTTLVGSISTRRKTGLREYTNTVHANSAHLLLPVASRDAITYTVTDFVGTSYGVGLQCRDKRNGKYLLSYNIPAGLSISWAAFRTDVNG